MAGLTGGKNMLCIKIFTTANVDISILIPIEKDYVIISSISRIWISTNSYWKKSGSTKNSGRFN